MYRPRNYTEKKRKIPSTNAVLITNKIHTKTQRIWKIANSMKPFFPFAFSRTHIKSYVQAEDENLQIMPIVCDSPTCA